MVRPRRPFADRLDQLDRYLADPETRARLTVAVDADRYNGRRTTTEERCAWILRLLVARTREDGLVSESLDQLAAANPFTSTDQVRRVLAVLRDAGIVETVERPVSPGRNSGPGRPPVYRVTFLRAALDDRLDGFPDPFPRSEPEPVEVVDNSEWARTSARPFMGMGAREREMGARVVHTPSVLIPRDSENISTETLMGNDQHPDGSPVAETLDDDRSWIVALVGEVKRRYDLDGAQRAAAYEHAAYAYVRWGILPIADYAEPLADWWAATWATDSANVERRLELADQLDNAARARKVAAS